MGKYILLTEGPDAKGLIFHVTSVLFEYGCNILKQSEYVSPDKHFFMRTEFEHPGSFEKEALLEALKSRITDPLFHFKLDTLQKKNIVILCTKEHHCLSEILVRNWFGEINANVLGVISNHKTLQPFVEKFGLPFHAIEAEGLSREEHEAKVLEILSSYSADYLVLAKYMRILSPEFIRRYPNKIINIHHSFLPAFVGAQPYKQAFDRGVKIIGATAHFVTDQLDQGPIIAQDTKEIDHRYSASDMARDGREVETRVLLKALEWVFSDRVFIYGNKTVIL